MKQGHSSAKEYIHLIMKHDETNEMRQVVIIGKNRNRTGGYFDN